MSKKEYQQPQKGAMGGPHGAVGGGEKPKNLVKSLKKLGHYCKPYLPLMIIAVIFAVLGSIFNVIGPRYISKITDLISAGIGGEINFVSIEKTALFLVALYATGVLFNYFQGFIMTTVTQKLSKNLRTQISDKINVLPLKYFDSTSTGDILSRVTNDVDIIGQTLNQSLGMMITAFTMFIGSLVMMLYTNWIMAATAVATTFIGFILMIFIISRSQKYFLRQQKELGKINGHIEEIYTGHNIVKAYNEEKAALEYFETINEKLYDSAWKSQFMSGLMMPLMNFIGNFSYVAVCVVGAALAMNGNISFGVIVAFMMYVRFFTQPLSQLAQAATNLQSAVAAGERVFELLDESELDKEENKNKKLSSEDAKGDVEFSHVCFGYNDDKLIIKNFSAHAKAGQKVAIVGPTGAGKTTIVNLLMRFYELKSGEIKIDGIPISELKRRNVHELFCMVLQDTWLFEGTIKENIIYSKENVTDSQVIDASKSVGLHHFVKTLPKGYDTVLNDKVNLSSGQKQLITIARAMIENAPLLILDEATSSVDTRTELLIQNAMDKLTEGRTSFVIAHRLSTIKNADLILVMNEGDITESGTHSDLLAKGGFYAELYNSQFENVS